jgi:AmmeMemoRadiSam system protein A
VRTSIKHPTFRIIRYQSQVMNTETGRTLIAIARNAIARRLGLAGSSDTYDAEWLRAPGASYVTLLREGKLRGGTGTLQAHRTLAEDVIANAIAAACSDLRFKPLNPDEFAHTRIEVCVLSVAETLQAADEAATLALLRPGTDGVILEYGRHRSSFLPEMWDQSANAGEFLAQLKYKAGLPPDFWSPEMRIARYTAIKWQENEPKT